MTTSVLSAAGALLATAGCGHPGPGESRQLRIATGSPGAVYFRYGTALAEIINRELAGVRASVISTAASAANLRLIQAGQAELAFTQADVLAAPRTGAASPDSVDTTGLLALARVYDDLLHLVVRGDGPIHALADLRGHRVSVGAPGSGTGITANRLLSLYTLDDPGVLQVSQLGLDGSVAALREGRIDAFFFSGGLPVEAISQLNQVLAVRLVDLGSTVEQMRQAYTDVYDVRAVPHLVYGLSAVNTIGDPNYLVVPRSLPDDLAYDLARILLRRREELGRAHPAAEWLDARTAISTAPLALHPGALRYYRDSKG